MSSVKLDSVFQFTGGMAVRINNTNRYIDRVFINGNEHFAFNDELVILPNLTGTKTDIKIVLGNSENIVPHLSYISKRMNSIIKKGNDLFVDVSTLSKAKFNFKASTGYLPINSDGFNYNNMKQEYNCFVNSNRTIELSKLKSEGMSFISSNIRINNISENDKCISLQLQDSYDKSPNQLVFSTGRNIQSILFDNKQIALNPEQDKYLINVEKFEGEKQLIINFD